MTLKCRLLSQKILEKTDLSDKNLSLVEIGTTNTRYSISSVEQDVEAVLGILKETFGERLQTHQVTTSNIKSLGIKAKLSRSISIESDAGEFSKRRFG